jgi:hypothetical protein
VCVLAAMQACLSGNSGDNDRRVGCYSHANNLLFHNKLRATLMCIQYMSPSSAHLAQCHIHCMQPIPQALIWQSPFQVRQQLLADGDLKVGLGALDLDLKCEWCSSSQTSGSGMTDMQPVSG